MLESKAVPFKEHTINCIFSDVLERDLDMLMIEEFVCSKAFLKIFTDKVGINSESLCSVYFSKTDISLGETDITVIIESNKEKIGLLIENKIDAIAMPEQANRYFQRGEKGIERGEYNSFYVFIVAPRKYLQQNTEAQKYSHRVEYEVLASYFEKKKGLHSQFKLHLLRQAIEKQKRGYQVEKDTAVTEFWRMYSNYQKEYYPEIEMVYGNSIKGAKSRWPRFRTVIDQLYIIHKTESGFIDLTFNKCADRLIDVEEMLSSINRDYHEQGFSVHKAMRSAVVRMRVPVLNLHQPFENQLKEVDVGLHAIKTMSELVKKFSYRQVMSLIQPSK